MGSKICMNELCGAATSQEGKKGWPLRSGGYADLCYNCGSAYENLVFCETFHLEETGWRECRLCNKNLHCGCIASQFLFDLLDFGGVGCTSCAKTLRLHKIQSDGTADGCGGALTINSASDMHSTPVESRVAGDSIDGKLTQLCKIMEANEPSFLSLSQRVGTNASLGQGKREEVMHSTREVDPGFLNATQSSGASSKFAKLESSRKMLDIRDMPESLPQPSLSIALGAVSRTPNFLLPFSNDVVEGKEQSKAPSPFQQGQRSRPILPKPSKSSLGTTSETNKGAVPQLRIARPPVDGRGKNHLLPRYWPRITDQELQQISGDLNSTIVPLFEKVLSASDAGRIGRLVLPKACAEAYFPPISQSEGVPLKIQDVKGKEWMLQFRFWPNNNSRMYVLEGVTPCIQSMQLRAGDTVIFSRIDPGGKLVMGFRKAANPMDTQDGQTSAIPSSNASSGTPFSGVMENLPAVSGHSGLSRTLKGSKDPHINALSEHLSLADADIGWQIRSVNNGGRTNDDSMQQPITEKKRTRNIGSKSKRLLMHSEDSLELRLTWEEAQDLLRPPPSAKPSIVTIEDHEFEEYDEPPVFGKKTLFTAGPSGEQEQWVQCDDCIKWRRLPVDVFLPPKWSCLDNVWDPSRSSCSALEEMNPKELENLFRMGRDCKKRRTSESNKLVHQEHELCGLDALASAAALGDTVGDSSDPAFGATTKHPRHRPGCTCIVCIQPPSGKGKHNPTCTCNVCLTVKRRFKTLMLRKKKRQSEREAENSQEPNDHRDESETNGTHTLAINYSEKEESQTRVQAEVAESTSGQIDLNCHPDREDMQMDETGTSLMNLVQAASLPLEEYMKQNGITSLMGDDHQQASPGSHCSTKGENERCQPEKGFLTCAPWEHNGESDEGRRGPDLDCNGLS